MHPYLFLWNTFMTELLPCVLSSCGIFLRDTWNKLLLGMIRVRQSLLWRVFVYFCGRTEENALNYAFIWIRLKNISITLRTNTKIVPRKTYKICVIKIICIWVWCNINDEGGRKIHIQYNFLILIMMCSIVCHHK